MSNEVLHPIIDSVINYIEMNNSGALLITGNWGCGKTYYMKETVLPTIKKKLKRNIVIVSLFGLNNLNDIPERVFYAYLDAVGKGKTRFNLGSLTNILKEFTEAIPKLNEYVDFNKLLGKGQGIYNFVSKDTIICLDDLERIVDKIDINEVLGVINELVENIGYKVIIIANEDFINKNQLIFKEKVVEKTIVFIPDTLKIFKEIASSYKDAAYTDYMHNNAISLISPGNKLAIKSESYRKNISNIRILKFAIEHFYKIFSYYKNSYNIEDSKIQLKLKNYWAFILAVSIEYKLNNISYEDKRTLDLYTHNQIANYDIDFGETSQEVSFDEETDDKASEDERKKKSDLDSVFQKKFYEKYFITQKEYPIFHSEIYAFITGGITPNMEKLEDEMNIALGKHIRENDPAFDLLSAFMNGIWGFSNEEISSKLDQLFLYVKQGQFNDYTSYLNASFFLLTYQKLFVKSKDEIENGIKEGIDLFSDRLTITPLLTNNIKMLLRDIPKSVVWIYDYIIEKISEKEEAQKKSDIELLEQNFCENLQAVITDCACVPYGPTPKYFNIPILNHIREEKIEEKISKAEPHDIYLLEILLIERYEKVSTDIVKEELPFIKRLKNAISRTNIDSPKLSNILIKKSLLPKIDSILSKYPDEAE